MFVLTLTDVTQVLDVLISLRSQHVFTVSVYLGATVYSVCIPGAHECDSLHGHIDTVLILVLAAVVR